MLVSGHVKVELRTNVWRPAVCPSGLMPVGCLYLTFDFADCQRAF
jgi:hypothetical protein